MSKKISIFNVQSDVTQITVDANDAQVTVVSVADNKTSLFFPRGALIHAACSESEIIIRQSRKLFARFFKKPQITINVPEHLVPSVQFSGKSATLNITGGIFGQLNAYLESGKATLSDAAFESVDVKGNEVVFTASSLTVKGCLSCNIQSGEATIENSFATHTACRNKGGNVGIVNLNCKDSFLEAEHGNINATILGNKKDFNVTLKAREGTCNSDSDDGKDCTGSVKAFAGDGNIVIDFVEENKEAEL
jgi:hypothetical protein